VKYDIAVVIRLIWICRRLDVHLLPSTKHIHEPPVKGLKIKLEHDSVSLSMKNFLRRSRINPSVSQENRQRRFPQLIPFTVHTFKTRNCVLRIVWRNLGTEKGPLLSLNWWYGNKWIHWPAWKTKHTNHENKENESPGNRTYV
jgi:hypothetical protein